METLDKQEPELLDFSYINNLLHHTVIVQRFFMHVDNYKKFKRGAKSWYDASYFVYKQAQRLRCPLFIWY